MGLGGSGQGLGGPVWAWTGQALNGLNRAGLDGTGQD